MDLVKLSTQLKRHIRPGVPKYVSLKDAIVEAIVMGTIQTGDKVPNEQELATVLPMSLGTIQKALRDLAIAGVLERKPGQGSFIRGQPVDGEMAHPFHCRFLANDGKSYLPVFSEVLSRSLEPAAGPWQQALGSSRALEITRRIRIADEFSVFSAFYVDADRLPVFGKMGLKELSHSNFKDIIFKSCGQAVTKIDLMMKQETAPPAVRALLDLGPRTLCTSLRAIGQFPNEDPVYYQHIYIPPSNRELHVVADSRAPGFGV